jgi:glucose 1-dehydrogenase
VRARGDQGILADDKPGVVINVSSVHQIIPKPNYLGYSVSKGGTQNLTRTLALEYGGRGIRVNGVGPGATITPINRAWVDDQRPGQVRPHRSRGNPGDVTQLAGPLILTWIID